MGARAAGARRLDEGGEGVGLQATPSSDRPHRSASDFADLAQLAGESGRRLSG